MNRNENLIVWRRTESLLQLAARCAYCEGVGSILTPSFDRIDCAPCHGRGWFGILPQQGATADPGSVEKVAVLGVRYASGVSLWNRCDRCACETVVFEDPSPFEPPRKKRKKPTKKDGKSAANGRKNSVRSTALAH